MLIYNSRLQLALLAPLRYSFPLEVMKNVKKINKYMTEQESLLLISNWYARWKSDRVSSPDLFWLATKVCGISFTKNQPKTSLGMWLYYHTNKLIGAFQIKRCKIIDGYKTYQLHYTKSR